MPSFPYWLAGCAATVPALLSPSATQAEGLYMAHADYILGTSFDLKCVALSFKAATEAEKLIHAEIDRLSQLLSTFRPDSEISRWLHTQHQAVRVSDDLFAVFSAFDHWQTQTRGAINAATEHITQQWLAARDRTVVLTDAEQRLAAREAQQQHWQLDAAHQTATRLSETPLRLHTFVKSYILDKAATLAMAHPDVRAVVLNSGGDLVIRGNWTESVWVTNPLASAENDMPLTKLSVENQSVATSGNYRRGFQIGNDWYSHIMNPLTGAPAQEVISATVIHPDAVTAGALATAFNVLSPAESAELAASLPGTEYLIVTNAGESVTSPAWNKLAVPAPANTPGAAQTARLLSISPQKDKLWNTDQELLVNLELSQFEGRFRRPFVAVWVEDQNHQVVRNLALWYNKPRWLPELRAFYSLQSDANIDLSSVTGATRPPGAYSLKWDGKDNVGQLVKQGKYTVCIEAAREHGTYQIIRQEMDFNGKLKQQTIPGNTEVSAASLDYRKKTDGN